MSSLFLQGLIFSTLVLGALAVLAWWLYLSPLKLPNNRMRDTGDMAVAASHRLAYGLALLIGIGSLLTVFGGYWDLSEHLVTGIVPGGEDFLWPPHLMVYAGFLVAFIVALSGLVAIAVPNLKRGIKDPRRWVRRNPFVGAVVIIAGYGLLSIPGDAIWHELYGIDLTAWSPPHLFLTFSAASLPVFAAGLFMKGQKTDRASARKLPNREVRNATRAAGAQTGAGMRISEFASAVDWTSIVRLLYLASSLLLLVFIGVVEWEVDSINAYVDKRPIWLYPTITGVASFFLLVVAKRLVPGPWTATVMALFYFGLRIAVSAFADVMSGAPPRMTLVFILGAVLLDLTYQWMQRFGFRPGDWQVRLAVPGAFMVGYTLVAQPTIEYYLLQFLPSFALPDHLLTALFTFLACAAVYPVAAGLGNWLSSSSRVEMETDLELPNAASVSLKS